MEVSLQGQDGCNHQPLVTDLQPPGLPGHHEAFCPMPESHLISTYKGHSQRSAESKGIRSSVPGTRDRANVLFTFPRWGIVFMGAGEEHVGRRVTGELPGCGMLPVGGKEGGRQRISLCRTAGVHPFFSKPAKHLLCALGAPKSVPTLQPD